MAEETKRPDNYRQASRQDYFSGTPGPIGYVYSPTTDQLKTGALQRVADAAERIATALETQNELTRIVGPGFQPDQYRDGTNHLLLQQASDSRVLYIQVLATSPHMAQQLSRTFGGVLQEIVRVANEQEGGVANG